MRSIIARGFAGLATIAVGQEQFSLSLVPSGSSATGNFTVGVYGDSSFGTHMLGGQFGMEITPLCSPDSIVDVQWSPASWSAFNTDGGYDGDGGYGPVIFGQLVIPGVPPFDVPAPGSELGGLIGTFTVEVELFSFDRYQMDLVLIDGPFSLEVIDINTGETMRDTAGTLLLGSAEFGSLCPSPGVCSLLAFSGLAATRRRRSESTHIEE